MTVGELIALLSEYRDDRTVIITHGAEYVGFMPTLVSLDADLYAVEILVEQLPVTHELFMYQESECLSA